jgi:hypothetical protein
MENAMRNTYTPEFKAKGVRLSVRYGIITPYTSFLIQEDDIFSRQGLEEAQEQFAQEAAQLRASLPARAR